MIGIIKRSLRRTHRLQEILLLLCPCIGAAQNLSIVGFDVLPLDLSARRVKVQDNNKMPCALLKINCNDDITGIQGSVIKMEEHGNEYWVYIPGGTKYIKILTRHHAPMECRLTDYIKAGVQSSVTYQLDLKSDLPLEILYGRPQTSIEEITDSIVSANRIETLMRNLISTNAKNICFRRGKVFPYERTENNTIKVGFLNRDLSEALPPVYGGLPNCESDFEGNDEDFSIDMDYHWVRDNNGLFGLMDSNGNKIAPFKYAKIYEPKEELSYARIVLAMDSLSRGYVLNRVTGEVISHIPEWDFVSDGYFNQYPTSLLKYTDVKSHKDYFIDKITGHKREIKIPKGYYFKEFLPFNHLRFQKNKSLDQKILNEEGRVVSEHSFAFRVLGDESLISPQYLFGTLGIYDLESEKFIYHGSAISQYAPISRNIIKIGEGVHTKYLNLESGSYSDEMPDVKSLGHKIPERTLVRLGVSPATYRSRYQRGWWWNYALP